jgi:fermentation-respiration switch protein FrsA (DUF1100 family)
MKRHRVLHTVLATFAFGAVCAALAAYATGSALVAPSPSTAGPLPPDLAGEPVQIPSASGSALSGWFIPGRRDAILLLHGVRASRHSQIERARLFHEAGYAVLVIDFQAHGESAGRHITFGHLESHDAQAAVAWLRERLPGQRIGVVAQSMGGAAAILAQPPLAIDALVAEAVYPDLDGAVKNRLQLRLGAWARTLSPVLTLQVRPRLGFSTSELRPIDRVGQLTMPKLFIAGTQDPRTRIAESRALHAAAAQPKALWEVSGAIHEDFYTVAPDEYQRRVLDFLQASLGRD